MPWNNPEKRRIYRNNRYKTDEKYRKSKHDYYMKNLEDKKIKRHKLYIIRKKVYQNYHQTPMGKFVTYKSNAKIRNKEFSLTLKDFEKLINSKCYYCGDKMDKIGIDRKDNSLGYTPKNSVPCCYKCNLMKRSLSVRDFLKQCRKIVKNFS